jgi:hypothetical protein
MDYSKILSRAWQIIWKHKVLWIFGILAGCAGRDGGGNFHYRQHSDSISSTSLQHSLENIPQSTLILIIIVAVVIILILVVIGVFLGTIGKIGGIKGTLKADHDMEAPLKFGELFRESMPYFWRVFLLGLLVGVIFLLSFVVGAVVAILLTALTLGIFLVVLIPLLCLLIPIGIVVGVIVEQATIAIVIENLGVIDGLKRGWEVVKTSPGPLAVMWLILGLGVRGIGNLILSIPMIAALVPLIVMLAKGMNFANSQLWMISLVCFVAYLPFLIVLSGILNSYFQSGWTLTFLDLTKSTLNLPETLEEPLPPPAG